jgi:transcriptional regulator of acetoin/glycerol metabolism
MNKRSTLIDGPFGTYNSTKTSTDNNSNFLTDSTFNPPMYTTTIPKEKPGFYNANILSNNSNKILRYNSDTVYAMSPELYFMDNIISNNPKYYADESAVNYVPSLHKFAYNNQIFFNKFIKSLSSMVDSCKLIYSQKYDISNRNRNTINNSETICYYLINNKFILTGEYYDLNPEDLDTILIMKKTEAEVKATRKDTVSDSNIHLYYSLTDSTEVNLLIKNINRLIQRYGHNTKKTPVESYNYINMVTYSQNQYMLSAFNIQNIKMENDILNVNYGAGFSEFHYKFMERMKNSKKGISLLHGTPGTGKTTYIRQIISELNQMKKTILYVGPEMVENIIKPDFFTFLKNEVTNRYMINSEEENENSNFVLILEDAEKILAARDKNNNSNSIINLLNMSDGILNDILNMQIIASFNMPIEEIDPAVLRAGRLIANKKFKKLSGSNLENALKFYDIEDFKLEEATIGEIFSFKDESEPIIN